MEIYQVSWEHCLHDCHLAGIQFRYNCDQLNEKAPIDLSVEVLQLRARKAEKGAVFSRVDGGGGNYKGRCLNYVRSDVLVLSSFNFTYCYAK